MTVNSVIRDHSECSLLWFARNKDFDPGTTQSDVPGTINIPGTSQVLLSSGSWLASGKWLSSRDGKNPVLACTFGKDVESPTGSCSFHVKPSRDRDWLSLIQPSDAFLVFMVSRKKVTCVSFVLVDRVGEGRAVAESGATVRTVVVSASDLGKVFLETSTVVDPALSTVVQSVAFYTQKFFEMTRAKHSISPVEAVLTFLDIFYNAPSTLSTLIRAQLRFPGIEDLPLAALLSLKPFVQVPMFGNLVPAVPGIAEAGNVWNLLTSYANRVVNEFFIDMRDLTPDASDSMAYLSDVSSAYVADHDIEDQSVLRDRINSNFFVLGGGVVTPDLTVLSPGSYETPLGVVPVDLRTDFLSGNFRGPSTKSQISLVFRQRPYDTTAFLKLPVVDVQEQEVISSDFGISDRNVYNFFRMELVNSFGDEYQELVYGIAINRRSVSKFGIRRMDAQSIYPFADSDIGRDWNLGKSRTPGDVAPATIYYVGLLRTWHAFNELMREGPMTLHFRPDIRVGVRLRLHYVDDGGARRTHQFYVQSVQHRFVYAAGQSTTSVMLTRGIPTDEGNTVSVDNSPLLGGNVDAHQANIYWTKDGPAFPTQPDTYEIVTQDGVSHPEEEFKENAAAIAAAKRKAAAEGVGTGLGFITVTKGGQ